jgi:hypothetical protein
MEVSLLRRAPMVGMVVTERAPACMARPRAKPWIERSRNEKRADSIRQSAR